ncbi:MAG: phosphoglucomutase/phosphomannomutase family protein [Candidatus Omnitrophica bacterium]|nr:phosphoglucomutase/phosphomannomutase family protein [Candidatus Omnitrophota bacterium]
MSKIKFGTDGWRAVISKEFTFDNVAVVAQAIADFVKSRRERVYKKRRLVVGYDTRFLSDEYAKTVACVLAANGIKTYLTDRPSPTPSVCVYIDQKKLTGGVIVTSSHNPPEYNGIKYKGFFAGSANSDIIDRIEQRLNKSKVKTMPFEEAVKKKKIVLDNIVKMHLGVIRDYANMRLLKKGKLNVLVDSMNGTGQTYLKEILKGTDIKLDFMYSEINPGFHGRAPEPNEHHLGELVKKVKRGRYDLGLATDGDSDRLAVVDEKGRLLSGHKVMAILLLHLLRHRKMRGGVVQTICGTGLINKMSEEYGLETYETPVGFKYICDIMREKDILIGGEETGGVAFKGYIPDRDGFMSALLVLELLIAEKKKLSEITAELDAKYGRFVYERNDMAFPGSKREKLVKGIKNNPLEKVLDKEVVDINDSDGTKFICEDGSWLLVRLSGTEPKLRIYSETHSKKRSLEYIEFGKKYASKLL